MQAADKSATTLYYDVRNSLICYTSIIHVLDKLEQETHLSQISSLFAPMISEEINFALQGNLTRVVQNGKFARRAV